MQRTKSKVACQSSCMIESFRFGIQTLGGHIRFWCHKLEQNNAILKWSRMSQAPLVTADWEKGLRSPWWEENRGQLGYRLRVETILWERSKTLGLRLSYGGQLDWRWLFDWRRQNGIPICSGSIYLTLSEGGLGNQKSQKKYHENS